VRARPVSILSDINLYPFASEKSTINCRTDAREKERERVREGEREIIVLNQFSIAVTRNNATRESAIRVIAYGKTLTRETLILPSQAGGKGSNANELISTTRTGDTRDVGNH